MKKARKGFTLVELMIVIGIISILGVMGIMAGGEATNIANAGKIVEDFKMLGSALNVYYADNRYACDKAATGAEGLKAETVIAGLAPYVKSTDMVIAGEATNGNPTAPTASGVYALYINGSAWWLGYKLPDNGTKLAQILANKAVQEGLKSGIASGDAYYANTDDVIYYQAK